MKKASLPLLLILCFSLPIFAQKAPVFANEEGAIRGYDAVAYFKEGKPVKGNPQLSYVWKGATWYFADRENLTAFKTSPEKFAPQFGGYCAYGMAEGHKAPTDPQAWTIVDDKLYLNYNPDVKEVWNKKQSEHIKTANRKWPTISQKE